MKRTIISKAIAASLLLGFSASSVLAEQQFNFAFGMPVQVQAVVSEDGCDNSPGPVITLAGQIVLGGLTAELRFQNNVKGTHTRAVEYASQVALVLPGGALTIPKQPALGGVGGNPWIYLQFVDDDGIALGPEMKLGRCVQGLKINKNFVIPASAATTVSAVCLNHPGPQITFGGAVTLAGLKANIILRNNAIGTHEWVEEKVEIEVIASGTQVVIPKSPAKTPAGAGGNPLIWLRFMNGDTTIIGDPIFLGRCNQI